MNSLKKLLFFYLFFVSSAVLAATEWKPLAPGISYTNIKPSKSSTLQYLHCFKIDLAQNRLQLAFAKDDLFPAETVKWLAKRNHALLAVNGGFFTSSWEPIGLRIQRFKKRSSLQPTSWWPIFYIKNNIPHIVNEKDYETDNKISFAVQGGPRLLRNAIIPPLKPGKAERTALGITENNEVIIVATENWPLSTNQLAHIFKDTLNCSEAINLDGGSSTQLYAHINKFALDIGSLALITDIVYVSPK